MLSLGQAIKRLRMSSGLTQKELAKLLDADPTYISHIEADRKEPSLTFLRNLAKTLKIPPGLFLAITLWADLPPEQRDQFKPILDRLLLIARDDQLGLTLK